MSLADWSASVESLMGEAYAGIAHWEAVSQAIDAAGHRLAEAMPDERTWGTDERAAAAAAKAEAMFG